MNKEKKKKLGSTPEIIERRKKVMRLRFIKRWPVEQIANVFGVTERTIYNDIQAITEYGNTEMARDELKQPIERTLWEASINYQERQMLRWQEYANAKHPLIKAKIINDIQNEEAQYYKLLQSLGVVEKVPEQTVVTNVWSDLVRAADEEGAGVAEQGQHKKRY